MTPQATKSANTIILSAAQTVAKESKAEALVVYADLCDSKEAPSAGAGQSYKTILITQSPQPAGKIRGKARYTVHLPDVSLTRMGLVKMATLMSFSQGVLLASESFVFVTGVRGDHLDTIVLATVGKEYELLQTVDQPVLTEHIRRAVFQKVLNLATSLAAEGREGRAIGALFVLGDTAEVIGRWAKAGRREVEVLVVVFGAGPGLPKGVDERSRLCRPRVSPAAELIGRLDLYSAGPEPRANVVDGPGQQVDVLLRHRQPQPIRKAHLVETSEAVHHPVARTATIRRPPRLVLYGR